MAESGNWRDETDNERANRYNQHAHFHWEQASVETCKLMNLLGYGPEIRQTRRDAYKVVDRIFSASGQGFVPIFTVGSKAEGLTRIYQSDIDQMFVSNDVICLENNVYSDTLPLEMTVLSVNTDMCYHGHCRLFLVERPGVIINHLVQNALCAFENGRALLCTDLYVNAFNAVKQGPTTIRNPRAGPSIPSSIEGILHSDKVVSFPCFCPSILRRWAERRRHWPSPDVVHKVVAMGAFVTPVGFKGSEYKHVEWRICFNTGENLLVSSLNNTQVYIYVILKMVVKDVLKPHTKEITSYTVKNIVLWLAENNPQELFNERTLLHWLHEGLRELRSAILTEHLMYYMIPERNLMAACGLEEWQQRRWIQIITDMIDEGPKVLLTIPKIRQAIISHPEPLMWYSKKRVELELLELKAFIRLAPDSDGNGMVNESDIILHVLLRRMNEILTEVRQRSYREGSRIADLDDIIVYMLM